MRYGAFEGPVEELIRNQLREIEEKEQVTILHAVESGSRAWGFASPDSDYDVRFVYVRRTADYLKLQDCDDFIDWALDETLDINGWDLSKALRHFHKSNATLFEWVGSPLVYATTPAWGRIRETALPYFSCKAAMYHYYGTARKNFAAYLTGDLVKYKKYFYVLRPILACKWIAERKTPPPVLFTELADAVLEEAVKPAVDALLEKKRKAAESGQGRRLDTLHRYLEENIEYCGTMAGTMADDRKSDWEALNRIFLDTLSSVGRMAASAI